ncbi:MAG: TlyA family RNA methyltransferase [Clostridiales bacterium]|nr:TlyA family RNA methyltransferase [Clostridiales bacterium]
MKKRLDVYLFEEGMVQSREKAQALIMAGLVYVNDQKSTKAGFQIKPDDFVVIRENPLPFVSRGGLKLQKALESFGLKLKGLTCLDVGSSTGGFTDCMLQAGAAKVYAVDVGYNQLAWSLRSDPRVVSLERVNFRHFDRKLIDNSNKIDFASVDVSFISLSKILPSLSEILEEGSLAVCLIKPQFEAGREKVGKKGVVREKSTHVEVIENVLKFSFENSFKALKLDYSPLKGPQGNIEYLLLLQKTSADTSADTSSDCKDLIGDLVERAHEELNGGS